MKFNEFILRSNDNYEYLKKYAKRNTTLCGITLTDLTHLRYITLKRVVPQLFNEDKYNEALYEILKDTQKNVTFTKVKRADNFKKYAFLLFVQDQYEGIKNMELNYLSTPPDIKLLNAGIKDLDVLDDKPMIRSLAMNDMSKEDYILNQPYYRIFDYNYEDTIRYRVSKKINENNKLKQ